MDPSADVPLPPATATTDASGAFTLRVDPLRAYAVTVEPLPAAALPRVPLVRAPVVAPAAGTVALPPFTFPRGLVVHGSATSNGQLAVAGALIEVFCAGGTDTCADRSYSYAETVSDAGGSFRVTVPEAIVVRPLP